MGFVNFKYRFLVGVYQANIWRFGFATFRFSFIILSGDIISLQLSGIRSDFVISDLANTTPKSFSAVERYNFLESPNDI